jgi:hypothetical protein
LIREGQVEVSAVPPAAATTDPSRGEVRLISLG